MIPSYYTNKILHKKAFPRLDYDWSVVSSGLLVALIWPIGVPFIIAILIGDILENNSIKPPKWL